MSWPVATVLTAMWLAYGVGIVALVKGRVVLTDDSPFNFGVVLGVICGIITGLAITLVKS